MDNGLQKLRKKINRQDTINGWKCNFRYCNFINSEDVFICKSIFFSELLFIYKFLLKIIYFIIDCSTTNPFIKEQINRRCRPKDNYNTTNKYLKSMSIPIYYEIKSTEKFKKEHIKINDKELERPNYNSIETNNNRNNKNINNNSKNKNNLKIIDYKEKEEEEENRKKFVFQKIKNVKNIITSINVLKKLTNNKIDSTNMSSNNNIDNSVSFKENKTYSSNKINEFNSIEKKKQRNYGSSISMILFYIIFNLILLKRIFFILIN